MSRRCALALGIVVLAVTAGGCARDQTLTGTVIDDGSGARYCGVVMESYPPQCGEPVELEGFSWDGLTYEEASGVRWADLLLTGTRDGDTLTLTEPPRNAS